MVTTVVKRTARRPPPRLPAGDIVLEPPPAIPEPSNRTWLSLLVILPMLAGSAAMAIMFSFQRPGPLGYLIGGLFGASMLGMFLAHMGSSTGQPGKAELMSARRAYMRHLAQHRRTVRNSVVQQRRAMVYRHPEPATLWSTVSSHRVWERRLGDGDFGVVRIAIGPQACATTLVPPEAGAVDDLDPTCAVSVRRFVKMYGVVPDLPMAVALRGFGRMYVRGDRPAGRALVRALLAQVVTFHAPDDMLVAVCCGATEKPYWEWVKWLPHARHPTKADAVGRLRMVTTSVSALEAMLDDELADRPRFNPDALATPLAHMVVVLDGGDVAGSDHLLTDTGVEGVTLIDLSSSPPRSLDRQSVVLDIDSEGEIRSTTIDGSERLGRPDSLTEVEAEALARCLAPLRVSAAARGDQANGADVSLSDLLGLGDPRVYDPDRVLGQRSTRGRLRVPIGVSPDGVPIELDIKESAHDGMGPHGLLVGATGSGKSELLRSLVIALAATHSSETLNLVLIDFKGGATFTRLDRLTHTSAVITNLADEIALVDRMQDAISGELVRRQELLRRAGNFASQWDYERARAAGAPLAPLPSLLIICDEFSELLSAKPDFIDMFVQIGRVGRSLGVHLLLASQRLEEGRLRGLDTHLSYRIALRTLSSVESRVVIGVTDAYELPRAPGHGYLRAGTETLTRFRAAYVSGRYRRAGTAHSTSENTSSVPILDFDTRYIASPVKSDEPDERTQVADEEVPTAETELDILIGRMQGRGVPARQIWLTPLTTPPTVQELLPPLVVDTERGLTVSDPELLGALRVPIGIVDRPFEQRRDPLWVDLSAAAGHLVVVGGPRSGKSTLVRALIASLVLTHTPEEVQFYCLDLTGGGLTTLRDLPHVGTVASRLDTDRLRRTVAEVRGVLVDRERFFATHAIESMAAYRRQRREGKFRDDPFGDVVLVIDGWSTLRADFEPLEPTIADIANRGLSYGVHLVVTATRWMDLRFSLRDLFGSRLELRLGDPTDSVINRKAAVNVPEGVPGRGLAHDSMHFLGALPRVDGDRDAASLSEGTASLVHAVVEAYQSAGAPAVRLLPSIVEFASLPGPDGTGRKLPIGVAEADLRPVYLDFSTESHLLLFGDVECGKSGFLRSVARGIAERYDASQARIMLVDYRHSLLGAVDTDRLLAYGTSVATTGGVVAEVAQVMQTRLPGPNVTPEQLRTRSWWSGPELFVIVDDYDLVASASANPLAPLVDYIAQARDVGLHVIVARRAGGAGRALYDPLIAKLRESSTPGIVMSGSRDEGQLVGTITPSQQPPGRGWLVTRREGARLVQLSWLGDDSAQ